MTASYRAEVALRKEDHRLVTGSGTYVGDIELKEMLHAAFVRSDVAHGTVTGMDTEDARAHPQVVAVYRAADLSLPELSSVSGPAPVEGMGRPILASDRIRHTGEAIAMIVAETPRSAADAVDLVWADIDSIDPVMDLRSAAQAPRIHEHATSNVVEQFVLGLADPNWDFEIDVTTELVNQRLAPVPIETLSALAVPNGAGVKLHAGHQAPHRLKADLGDLLDFPVEVSVPDVGGGFGMKARTYPEYLAIAQAAHLLQRPVRWLQTRREHFMTGSHGRDMIHTVRLAGDASGKIRRAHVDILSSVGAYPYIGGQVATFSRLVAQGLYDIEHFTLSSQTVVTNTAPIAPYRGAGRPEAAYAIERAVDAFARAAKQDPLVVRRANVFTSLPQETATGAKYDSGNYGAALDEAARLVDLDGVRAQQRERRANGGKPLGIGFGAFIERAGGPANSEEFAKVEITPEGGVTVFTGSTSNGQGHETVWAQVAGQVFDVGIDRVDVVAGDTELVERGWGSSASRSAQIGASAVWRTAHRVKDAATQVAAELLEASPDDLRLEGGVFSVAGVPGTGVSLADVAAAALGPLSNDEWYSPGAQTFPYGVHVAVVEVEVETGEVDLLHYVAVDDCGNILNPMIVDGQTHGSVAQGIGQAMYESVIYGDEGQVISSTLMDYLLPTAADIPKITTGRVISPAPSNPLGVKGAGEGGCIGAPPAIVNAVLDALAPLGVTDLAMPLRPSVVWKAIQQARP